MRSNLVYAAGIQIENRFLLAATVMQVVRRFHVNSTRTEDTINQVFTDVANNRQFIGTLPEATPPPAIDVLLIAPAA